MQRGILRFSRSFCFAPLRCFKRHFLSGFSKLGVWGIGILQFGRAGEWDIFTKILVSGYFEIHPLSHTHPNPNCAGLVLSKSFPETKVGKNGVSNKDS
jgi:hypothetical protein